MQQFTSNFPSEGGAEPAVKWVEIGPEQAGQRIDNFLVRVLKGVPKSRIYRLLRTGEVRVNKGRIKAEYKLVEGDVVRIPPVRMSETAQDAPATGLRKVQALEDAILFENDGLLVLNKPAGMAVHGGSGVSWGVIEALRALRPQAQFLELVHRLDRDTSGCLMVAKKRSALRSLHEALREKDMDKVYLALVVGSWSSRKTLVSAPLHKNELASGERIVRVREDGKAAETRFAIVEKFGDCTLVQAMPLTGRTHQIRVHAQHAGHPLLGDEKYGNEDCASVAADLALKRLFLHAAELRFVEPLSGKLMTVKAPLPQELEEVLTRARE